jgi:pilus biogenesis lipoprotein CpaD
MSSQFLIKQLGTNMRYPLLILSLFLIASCSDTRLDNYQNTRFKHSETGKPYDQNSSFGEIKVFEDTWVGKSGSNDLENLLAFINQKTKENKLRKFILIDISYGEKASAQNFAKILNQSLVNQSANRFEIKLQPGPASALANSLSVKIRSVEIQPKDCSPDKEVLNRTVGGYYEAKFGCAYANNIAAMLDNPQDAIMPRGSEPANAQRVIRILRAYLDGAATGAAIPANEAGEASEVSSSN